MRLCVCVREREREREEEAETLCVRKKTRELRRPKGETEGEKLRDEKPEERGAGGDKKVEAASGRQRKREDEPRE